MVNQAEIALSVEGKNRIVVFLPVHVRLEHKAFAGVLRYLTELTKDDSGQMKPKRIDGFTQSLFDREGAYGFKGHWWSTKRAKWDPESVALIIADYGKAFDDSAVEKFVWELAAEIHKQYRIYGSPQEQVWVTTHVVKGFAVNSC